MSTRRLSGQVITRDELRASYERDSAKSKGGGRGKQAEQAFEAECRALQERGELLWWRVPDPLVPTGERTSRGLLVCTPREREPVCDYLVAPAALGHQIGGVEVKSCAASCKSWSPLAHLRPGQRAALALLAAAGCLCGVYLVRGESERYWLPADEGGQLACGERLVFEQGAAWRIKDGQTWLDAALARR